MLLVEAATRAVFEIDDEQRSNTGTWNIGLTVDQLVLSCNSSDHEPLEFALGVFLFYRSASSLGAAQAFPTCPRSSTSRMQQTTITKTTNTTLALPP